MGLTTHLFRIPRPQSFLYAFSLRTGVELITLSLLFNKGSGLYGLLALITGFHLSPVQLSMYIYSVIALVITVLLFPHIRKQSPLQNLALAWLYLLDTAINAAYTAAFALSWFLTISEVHRDEDAKGGPGKDTIKDSSGFTNPELNVSSVSISGLKPGQDTVAASYPTSASASPTTGTPTFSHGILQPESLNSIITIITLSTIRVYFILILLSYARFVIRAHIAASSRTNFSLHTGSSDANILEKPFEANKPEGQGWRGKLGRTMIALGKGYFLGGSEGDVEEVRWMDAVGGKFRRSGEATGLEAGVNTTNVERERRRRSGTGPPLPPPNLGVAQPGMLNPVQPAVKLQNLGESR